MLTSPDTMDKKIIAIVIVAIIAIAGIAVVVMSMNNSDGQAKMSVVGRVNSEGSGIILAQDQVAEDYITVQSTVPGFGATYIYNTEEELYYVFNVETWGGKVFATPGLATIQHVQLMQLATMMGLKFVSYTDGMTTQSDTLYHVAGVPSFAEFQNKQASAPLVGYIIWEAQFSVGLQADYVPLALTNDLFEGHTCCIIGASNKYLFNEANTLEVFLNVYSKAVDRINAALIDPESDDYAELIRIAKNRVSMPDSLTDEQKENAIISALYNVTYLYADNAAGSLSSLEGDIAELAESLYNAGQIENSAKDLGFSSYDAMAKAFVDERYMKEALTDMFEPLTSKKTINVAAISGDIHQIALWFAKDTNMFEDANLNINVYPQGNGPSVWGLLSNGEADIAFLGAPPMTIKSMNAQAIGVPNA